MYMYIYMYMNVCMSPCVYIIAVDSYRVRLLMVPGVSCSDYINASYVDVSL